MFLALYLSGVQNVAPEVGARCVVGFRDSNERFAYIVDIYATPNDPSVLFYNNIASTHIPRYLI
jgi:hypothetical protein